MSLDEIYREVIMDHYQHPRHRGHLQHPSITVGLHNPTCGDEIVLDVKVADDGTVEDASFEGQGCSISMAAASMFIDAVRGKPVAEALAIAEGFKRMLHRDRDPAEDLGDLESLEGVSKFPARVKCATLVMQAFEKGMADYRTEEGASNGNPA